MEWHESSLPLAWLLPRTADLADQHEERVIEFIHDALFERDNGIVRDANLFRADLGAALCDVAQADAQFLAEQPSARRAQKSAAPRTLPSCRARAERGKRSGRENIRCTCGTLGRGPRLSGRFSIRRPAAAGRGESSC